MNDHKLIKRSMIFDESWYRSEYPDVEILDVDPIEHYLFVGARMGRNPGPSFDTKFYLSKYKDVAEVGVNPLVHYLRHGKTEGRLISPAAGTKHNGFPPSFKSTHTEKAKYDICKVDVIVPVFNAIIDVKRCLYSCITNASASLNKIIIVNDGSNAQTTHWLRNFSQENTKVILIENKRNLGYTRAINVGIGASTAGNVVILNSDTIVTPRWIEKLLECAYSSPKIGIVGPLSNAASWQNVPQLFDGKVFAVNSLPEHIGPGQMANIVESSSLRMYPRVPIVNGFCFFIKREVIDKIGPFDEETFPTGYGEENDFCIRAAQAGFELAIADDAYIFHAKSKSFGHEKRKKLSAEASAKLERKHSREIMDKAVHSLRQSPELNRIREIVSGAIADYGEHTRLLSPHELAILFVLPSRGGGGGTHSVVQEVCRMRDMGVRAYIAVPSAFKKNILSVYSDAKGASEAFVFYDSNDLYDIACTFNIAVATINYTVSFVKEICSKYTYIMPAYYIQDYEPLFFPNDAVRKQVALSSYTLIEGCLNFAKTHWIIDQVESNHGVSVNKIAPSIDHSIYKPAIHRVDGKIHIAAMIRPDGRRGAERTIRVLTSVVAAIGDEVRLHLFGCETEELRALAPALPAESYGVLDRSGVASVLQRADFFVDLSDYQAFGRTALEAMACGATAVVPSAGGTAEYAIDGVNAIIVDTTDENSCANRIIELATDRDILVDLKLNALETASKFTAFRAAAGEIALFSRSYPDHLNRIHGYSGPTIRIVPDVRDDLLPTGSAFVRTLLPYAQMSITGCKAQVCDPMTLPDLRRAQDSIAILSRKAADFTVEELSDWLTRWKSANGKIIYEIDDDLLDRHALIERGFTANFEEIQEKIVLLAKKADIVTVSTEPLADRIRGFCDDVVVVPNFIDENLWRLDVDAQLLRPKPDMLTIGYVGTPTHSQDLEVIKDAMRQIEKRYKDRVKIEVIGAYQHIEPLFGQKVNLPKNTDYPSFVKWLLDRAHWDIGIIPLVDDDFNRSKSHLKFLEMAALGAALVVSDVPSYSTVARNGSNCIVASNTTESWVEAVERLIDDNILRASLAANAKSDVRENYTIQRNADIYRRVLTKVLSVPPSLASTLRVPDFA